MGCRCLALATSRVQLAGQDRPLHSSKPSPWSSSDSSTRPRPQVPQLTAPCAHHLTSKFWAPACTCILRAVVVQICHQAPPLLPYSLMLVQTSCTPASWACLPLAYSSTARGDCAWPWPSPSKQRNSRHLASARESSAALLGFLNLSSPPASHTMPRWFLASTVSPEPQLSRFNYITHVKTHQSWRYIPVT